MVYEYSHAEYAALMPAAPVCIAGFDYKRNNNMYTVRRAEPHELEKLLVLYSFLHDHDEKAAQKDQEAVWNQICDNSRFFTYFVIEEKDSFIASCNLTVVPNLTRGCRWFAVIENVITHPDYRRKGLARMVLEEAKKTAKEKNCYKVMLLSSAERTGAHELYKKIGFSGTAKKGYVLKF